MSKKTAKHSQRQGHPAKRHPTSKQAQPTKRKIVTASKSQRSQLKNLRLGLLDLVRLGFLVLSMELAAVLIGFNGRWIVPLAGGVWSLCVLLPILLRRPEKMGIWMLGISVLLLTLIFSQSTGDPVRDTATSTPVSSQPVTNLTASPVQPAGR